jgi:hypothetical protein
MLSNMDPFVRYTASEFIWTYIRELKKAGVHLITGKNGSGKRWLAYIYVALFLFTFGLRFL